MLLNYKCRTSITFLKSFSYKNFIIISYNADKRDRHNKNDNKNREQDAERAMSNHVKWTLCNCYLLYGINAIHTLYRSVVLLPLEYLQYTERTVI